MTSRAGMMPGKFTLPGSRRWQRWESASAAEAMRVLEFIPLQQQRFRKPKSPPLLQPLGAIKVPSRMPCMKY
ncbi:hypothetical protein EWB00_000351 [Schistosoma japonicum]|uniref:Uncharacterized protein n=1 Tax=Schistosoma japonicum TaxID=6182 RepID=A0A4Z2CKG9_SCHJA|nr:hypothetical protein EWB00_000351 [Schistosoma japonicum]